MRTYFLFMPNFVVKTISSMIWACIKHGTNGVFEIQRKEIIIQRFFVAWHFCVCAIVSLSFLMCFFNVRVMSLISATQLVSLILLRSSLAKK